MEYRPGFSLSAIEAVKGRRSVRRFLPNAISESVIREILAVAARAPSGTNSQPWFVHVVTGRARDRLSQAVTHAAQAGETSREYPYFPHPLWEPYIARRRKVGFDLYALYGVERHDMAARAKAGLRNFEFFGAPVGLFFVMERALQYGSWLDMGMYMQNVMTAARSFGLETCPQEAWCQYGAVIHRELRIDEKFVVVSGMSLGFEDTTAKENRLVTEREPLDEYTTFHVN